MKTRRRLPAIGNWKDQRLKDILKNRKLLCVDAPWPVISLNCDVCGVNYLCVVCVCVRELWTSPYFRNLFPLLCNRLHFIARITFHFHVSWWNPHPFSSLLLTSRSVVRQVERERGVSKKEERRQSTGKWALNRINHCRRRRKKGNESDWPLTCSVKCHRLHITTTYFADGTAEHVYMCLFPADSHALADPSLSSPDLPSKHVFDLSPSCFASNCPHPHPSLLLPFPPFSYLLTPVANLDTRNTWHYSRV